MINPNIQKLKQPVVQLSKIDRNKNENKEVNYSSKTCKGSETAPSVRKWGPFSARTNSCSYPNKDPEEASVL